MALKEMFKDRNMVADLSCVSSGEDIEITVNGLRVASVYGHDSFPTLEGPGVHEHDVLRDSLARLFVASPALFAACEAIVAADDLEELEQCHIEAARQALAAARGN